VVSAQCEPLSHGGPSAESSPFMSTPEPSRAPGGIATRRTLVGLLAVVGLVVPATVVAAGAGARAAGFDPDGWSAPELVVGTSVARKGGAELEVLPDGRLVALTLVDGATFGHAGSTVLVSRVRGTGGSWAPAEVVDLGAGAVTGSTFDTFVDGAGRILAIWAEQGATSGQWPVRSVSRDAAGVWGTPEDVYTARTNGALSDLIEVWHVRPRLVPTGAGVTVAWADVEGYGTARIDVEERPFNARRWVGGQWSAPMTSDGYGAAGAAVLPSFGADVTIYANPSQASRAADGRISYVYTLRKIHPVQTVLHPLSDGFPRDANEPDVWDGIPEAPWTADSSTSWVVHLDADAEGWGEPEPLITSGGSVVLCNPAVLPDVPPLEEHWSVWKAFSLDPGITYSCPSSSELTKAAWYGADGALDIELNYRASPTARVKIQQYLDSACDAGGSSPFCFDRWDSTTWGVNWPEATVRVSAGADGPGTDAVREGPLAPGRQWTVTTASGDVTVRDAVGADLRSLSVDRATGTDLTWTHPDMTTGVLNVSNVFAVGDDVAIFFHNSSATTDPRCGLLLVRGTHSEVVGPLSGCIGAVTTAGSHAKDVVQLPDGRLAFIDASVAGVAVRFLGVEDSPSPSPTPTPSPTLPGPTPPPPTPAPPSDPTPAPKPKMTMKKKPWVKGKARIGTTLRAKPGKWKPKAVKVRYQWFAGSKKIAKGTKAKLVVKKKWKGKKIKVRVTVSSPKAKSVKVVVKVKGKVR